MADLIDAIRPYTKASIDRIGAMFFALDHIDTNKIDGDVVECGVWRAGHIILARKKSPHRVCWLYDTFEGMTAPGEFDQKPSGKNAMASYLKKKGQGWAAVSLDDVKANFRETDTYDERLLRFVVGPVEQTLLVEANLPDKIALLRLDTDWYASTKIELEVLYPRLQSGGVLIVDDYGHWLGARKAVDDYFLGTVPLTKIDYTAVMLVK